MLNLNKENILMFLRKNREYLSSQYGVKSIGLMGSYARDEHTIDSDIDFIVEFDEVSYSKLAGLVTYLESAFARKVDIIRKRDMMRKSLLTRAKKEAIYA
ncbi:MAG: nucleotidyltransferase domain-containing protein [Ignavibacteria bacterium]|nr:nucleotidyltransferase domain-containing protein [Ignavibacteria bacterium]